MIVQEDPYLMILAEINGLPLSVPSILKWALQWQTIKYWTLILTKK